MPVTKGKDKVIFVTEAAGRVHKQIAKCVYVGATVFETADLSVEISRRVLLSNVRLRRYGLSLYDQSTTPLRLKVRMFKAHVVETMLYGCVTRNLNHLVMLHKAHHRLLLRCIGWKRKWRDDHMLFCADALARTGCENVETTVRKRRTLIAGFVARRDSERLAKRVLFGEVGGGKGYSGGQEQDR